MRLWASVGAWLLLASVAASTSGADADASRAAKALFFDRKYAEARAAWEAIVVAGRGDESESAAFWIARCSENLGELDLGFKQYSEFLARQPKDVALAEEAKTSRVGIAARLVKSGRPDLLPVLQKALADPSRTVRYFTALQASGLGGELGRLAVPVLQGIVCDEKDPDLVDRAKLGLLKVDPMLLSQNPCARAAAGSSPTKPARPASWIRIRIYERGSQQPSVSINLPFGLAEMVFKSLPEDAQRELKRKGLADADAFWEKLKGLGPAQILDIQGEDGEKIQIWLE